MPTRILFVCLGNICRSPLAEGIFLHLCRERGRQADYAADSAGMGSWHAGERPDGRALATAAARGVELPGTARQVRAADFKDFDLILAMDRSNFEELLALCPPAQRGKIRLMREYDPQRAAAPLDAPGPALDVPDPYYGDARGFAAVFDILHRSCGALLDSLDGGLQRG